MYSILVIIFIQETKLRQKNKLMLNGYVVFYSPRPNSAGGGILTAVHEALEPTDISNNDDNVEILTVEAKIKNQKVRFINGYVVQENTSEDQKWSFMTNST